MVKHNLRHDRAWRKVLEDNEHLRGRDYGDKKILEQEEQIDLGYAYGFDQDIKRINKIVGEE